MLRKLYDMLPWVRREREAERAREAAFDEHWEQRRAWMYAAFDAGFQPWFGPNEILQARHLGSPYPQQFETIAIQRELESEVSFVNPRDLPPWYDVVGVWWKPWDGATIDVTPRRALAEK